MIDNVVQVLPAVVDVPTVWITAFGVAWLNSQKHCEHLFGQFSVRFLLQCRYEEQVGFIRIVSADRARQKHLHELQQQGELAVMSTGIWSLTSFSLFEMTTPWHTQCRWDRALASL